MNVTVLLDLKGLKCPAPALKTKRQLRGMRAGEVLHVECTDPLSSLDIPFLAHELGHAMLKQDEAAGTFSFWIEVAADPAEGKTVWPLEENK